MHEKFFSQDKSVAEILKIFRFTEVKTTSTPMETQKPLLKDEDGEEVDVHMYSSTIGSLMYLTYSRPDIMFAMCACARYQVNQKVSHPHVVKRIFRYLKGQPKLGLWYLKGSPFDLVAYTNNDYAGASLDRKSTIGGKAKKSVNLMMEKLFRMELKLMLFWSTVKAKTINGEVQLHALVDGKKIIITESTIRRDLQLEDAKCVDYLPNFTIFEQLTLMGSKTTAWNEFSSTMASAIIYLGINQKFNFSKYIFESMIRNLDNLFGKFLMYLSDNVANEAVYKELGDSLVRAATTASSLEAEQDSGNITKTRSKATPNESSSLGTTSGGGPRCQETMGVTIAQTRVLDLEKTKTSQHNEIASLKRRVKKLEKKNRSRTHNLKRSYKVGLTARVESSRDEESLGEDASKQGRINAIIADEEITLVSVQDDADKEMFDVDALNGKEVFVAGQNENDIEEVVDDKGKGIMIEEHVKPMKKKDLIRLDEEVALKLQAEFDEEERLAREKPKKVEESNIALIETWDDIQTKIDADHQLAKRLQNMEGYKLNDLKLKDFDSIQEMFDRAFKRVNTFEDFRTELVEGKEKRMKKKTIDAIPLAVNHMLKSFDREDLETLYKLVKAKYESTRPMEDLDLVLWNDLKTMFKPHVEDNIYMLVEKKYTLTPSTLTMMLEKKLRIDYESEMAYQLLKFIAKQIKKITAAHVCVNTALMKLVLLMDFKENMLSATTASTQLVLLVQS
ncbi:hypothetical protein Tco_0668672 [Tanacetum coccineum]